MVCYIQWKSTRIIEENWKKVSFIGIFPKVVKKLKVSWIITNDKITSTQEIGYFDCTKRKIM